MLQLMQSPPGAVATIDGREYLYFGGTSYLGLHGHPAVVEAACEATRRYGVHTATSRAGFGVNPPLRDVETTAAQFFGTEAAFYFVSGYVANHILAQGVRERIDRVFIDEAAHYCVHEAALLAQKPIVSFNARDAEDLRLKLKSELLPGERPLVMSDGLSPMGELAPLAEYVELLREYRSAVLLVDDAHGVVTLGKRGCGTVEHAGLWSKGVNGNAFLEEESTGVHIVLGGTLSKAAGGYGGIIFGGAAFLEHIRHASQYYRGSSAPPAAAAAASAEALRIVGRQPELRAQLKTNARALRRGLQALGFDVATDSPAPMIMLQFGDDETMRQVHQRLCERGILVPYFKTYAGVAREGALRIAVFADHTKEMIERMLSELKTCV